MLGANAQDPYVGGVWTRMTSNINANVRGSYTSGGLVWGDIPGSRAYHTMVYSPTTDSLYIFGGLGLDWKGTLGMSAMY